MHKELLQKKVFIKREAKIMETKVIYKSSFFGKQYEVSIPFENLSLSKETYILNRKNFYIPTIVFGLFTFACFVWRNDKDFVKDFGPSRWIFWSVCFLVSLIVYLISVENLWKVRVENNTYLFFLKNIPDAVEVEKFLNCLFETRDKYLRETYFFEPNRNLPFENQKSNLQWLRRMEVITGSEFQNSMKRLEELFNLDSKKIGFN